MSCPQAGCTGAAVAYLIVLISSTACLQKIKAGTYDDIFGRGFTPSWALPTDVFKYQDDKRIDTEAGFQLNYQVLCFVIQTYDSYQS